MTGADRTRLRGFLVAILSPVFAILLFSTAVLSLHEGKWSEGVFGLCGGLFFATGLGCAWARRRGVDVLDSAGRPTWLFWLASVGITCMAGVGFICLVDPPPMHRSPPEWATRIFGAAVVMGYLVTVYLVVRRLGRSREGR